MELKIKIDRKWNFEHICLCQVDENESEYVTESTCCFKTLIWSVQSELGLDSNHLNNSSANRLDVDLQLKTTCDPFGHFHNYILASTCTVNYGFIM